VPGRLVRLHHGVGRALDAALHAQCLQQMPHEAGLAGAQRAVQGDEGVAQAGRLARRGRRRRCRPRCGHTSVSRARRQASYNRRVAGEGAQSILLAVGSSCGPGRASWDFPKSAWPGRPVQSPSPACWPGCTTASMARHGLHGGARPQARPPGRTGARHRERGHRAHGLSAGATPAGLAGAELARLARPGEAVVSVYARGRDYHKVLRRACRSWRPHPAEVGPFGHRCSPIRRRCWRPSWPPQRPGLARQAHAGADREAGSMFFLGEIYLDLALPRTAPVARIAAAAAPASTPARRRPSWRRTGWMRGAASRT
jgi:hypothetical protein